MLFRTKIKDGKLVITYDLKDYLKQLGDSNVEIRIDKVKERRTLLQNNALHLYFEMLAEALNEAGLDMRKTLRADVEISWNSDLVKKYLWKPVQKAIVGHDKTRKLKKDEVNKVYDHLNRLMSQKFGVYVPFPSVELLMAKGFLEKY